MEEKRGGMREKEEGRRVEKEGIVRWEGGKKECRGKSGKEDM